MVRISEILIYQQKHIIKKKDKQIQKKLFNCTFNSSGVHIEHWNRFK